MTTRPKLPKMKNYLVTSKWSGLQYCVSIGGSLDRRCENVMIALEGRQKNTTNGNMILSFAIELLWNIEKFELLICWIFDTLTCWNLEFFSFGHYCGGAAVPPAPRDAGGRTAARVLNASYPVPLYCRGGILWLWRLSLVMVDSGRGEGWEGFMLGTGKSKKQ